MTFDIRDVEEGDLYAALRLNESVVPAVNSIDRQQMDWFAENAACFRVAIQGGELAAFLIGMRPGTDYASPNYRWFSRVYDDFGYVDRVAVAATARRQGLATRMYRDFAAQLLPQVDVMTCEVNIRPPNASSMRFHESLGFRRVGSQILDDGAKEVALMAWTL